MDAMLSTIGHAGWGWGWIFPLAWLVIIALFWTFAWRGPWRRRGEWRDERSPRSVLGERYARGEIDEDEYRTRLAVLRERG
jgi:putative membrane protein